MINSVQGQNITETSNGRTVEVKIAISADSKTTGAATVQLRYSSTGLTLVSSRNCLLHGSTVNNKFYKILVVS